MGCFCRCLCRTFLLIVITIFSCLWYVAGIVKLERQFDKINATIIPDTKINKRVSNTDPEDDTSESEEMSSFYNVFDSNDDNESSDAQMKYTIPKTIRLLHRFTNSIHNANEEKNFIPKLSTSGLPWIKIGYLYDKMMPLYRKAGKRNWMELGESKPVLISSLTDEEDWDKAEFFDPLIGWGKRFSHFKKDLQDNYVEVESTGFDVSESPSSPSTVSIHDSPPESGSWAFATNICYNAKDYSYTFYNMNSTVDQIFGEKFKKIWKFNNKNEAIPKDAQWVDDKDIFIFQYPLNQGYDVIFRSLYRLLLVFQFPKIFPPLQTIYLPQFSMKNNRIIYGLITNLFNIFPIKKSVKLIKRPDIKQMISGEAVTSPLLCFPSATLCDDPFDETASGVFGGWMGIDILRVSTYRNYALDPRTATISKLSLMVLENDDVNPLWKDVKSYYSLIDSTFNNLCSVSLVYARNLTFINYVKLFSRASIVVSPHNSILTHMLWMRPRTAVIEVMPPFFVCNDFKRLAQLCRLQYFEVSDFNYKHTRRNPHDIQKWYESEKIEEKQKLFVDRIVQPQEFNLLATIECAYEYVKRTTGVLVHNDLWTPVFY